MSLLPRRAARKERLELTVYTALLQIIFLEGNEAGKGETLTWLVLSHVTENKPRCKHPERASAVLARVLSSAAGAQGPRSTSSDAAHGNFPSSPWHLAVHSPLPALPQEQEEPTGYLIKRAGLHHGHNILGGTHEGQEMAVATDDQSIRTARSIAGHHVA